MAHINGYINVSKLKKELIKRPDLIAFKTKDGEACVNITIWINEEVNEFKKDCSIQLNPPKDIELDENIYIGNGITNKGREELKRRENLAANKLTYADKAKEPEMFQNDDLPF